MQNKTRLSLEDFKIQEIDVDLEIDKVLGVGEEEIAAGCHMTLTAVPGKGLESPYWKADYE